jgi:starch-binding outer membrane protein, SusD/RagB family
MKKLFIYTIIIATWLSLNSCSDWLSLSPEDNQTTDDYWNTKEEVEAVLAGGYSKMRNCLESMLVWGELRGTDFSLTSLASDDQLNILNWNILPSNSYTDWAAFYKVINQANMVIKYAPSVMDKDPSFYQSVMESYVAEAFFQRALAYFYLVRNFRDVPLVLEPYMTDDASFDLAKSAGSVIFKQIKVDLDTALVATKEYFSETWETKGRATKWAVYTALADVCLWTGDYAECITACDAVINSGQVGLINGAVNLTNNWFTIFNPGNSNEGIFELQYNYDKSQTNSLLKWFYTSCDYTLSDYALTLFVSSTEDIRGEGATYLSSSSPYIWKYVGTAAGSGVTRSYSDQNWIIYRMADIYLMKAEALVMQGDYTTATELVNKIRARAGITVDLDTKSTELEMLSMILDERVREFAGEGKRWYDLLRVARRNDYQYLDYMITQVTSSASSMYAPIVRATLLDEDSHYLPIATDELELNSLLVQNPYYENLE